MQFSFNNKVCAKIKESVIDEYYTPESGKLIEGAVYPLYYELIDEDSINGNPEAGYREDMLFHEFGYLADPSGYYVPVLYKGDEDYDTPDYEEPFFYCGQDYIEGVLYDKWRCINEPGGESNGYWWTDVQEGYAYTSVIVEQINYPDFNGNPINKLTFEGEEVWVAPARLDYDNFEIFGSGEQRVIAIPTEAAGNDYDTIGVSGFEGRSLTGFSMPNTITNISDYAFYYNDLRQVALPDDGVQKIGRSAFEGNNDLFRVHLPNSLTSLGPYAFQDCYALSEIVIPVGVTTMGTQVFYDSRTTVYCEATAQPSGWASGWDEGTTAVYWYSKNQPTTSGNYWRYLNNIPTPWPVLKTYNVVFDIMEMFLTNKNGSVAKKPVASIIGLPSIKEGESQTYNVVRTITTDNLVLASPRVDPTSVKSTYVEKGLGGTLTITAPSTLADGATITITITGQIALS